MQLFQEFTRIILLISLSAWIIACAGGNGSSSTTSTPWGLVELIETDVTTDPIAGYLWVRLTQEPTKEILLESL